MSVARPDDAAGAKPNIIILFTDDHGWPFYGFMQHKMIKTPHLDELAKSSAVFPNGYVAEAHCTHSHHALLSGLNLRDVIEKDLGTTCPIIPQVLKDTYRYRTFAQGKWWIEGFQNFFPQPIKDTGDRKDGKDERVQHLHFAREERRTFPEFIQETTAFWNTGRFLPDGLEPEKGLNRFLSFLGRATPPREPWFYWCAPNLPHHPFEGAPDRFHDLYPPTIDDDRLAIGKGHARDYFANISWLDETVGKVRWILKEGAKRGLIANDTLLFFLSDNGAALDKSKGQFTEAGTRTPILVNYPHKIEPKVHDDKSIGEIDIFRTILDYVRQEDVAPIRPRDDRSPWMDDVSLKRIIESPLANAGWQPSWRQHVFFGNPSDSKEYSVRDVNYKLYIGNQPQNRKLFQLTADPFEKKNLLDEKGKPKSDAARVALDRLLPIVEAWSKRQYAEVERRVAHAYPASMAAGA